MLLLRVRRGCHRVRGARMRGERKEVGGVGREEGKGS